MTVRTLNDPVTYSSAASAHRAVPSSLDPPEHARFRAVVDLFFTPDRMRSLEPRIRAIAGAVADGLPRGIVVDAVTDIGSVRGAGPSRCGCSIAAGT